MNNRIRYRLLKIRSRILRKTLALIGIAGLIVACNGNQHNNKNQHDKSENYPTPIREDSLELIKADSFLKAQGDSVEKAFLDSVKNAKKNGVTPTYVPPEIPATDYGVLPIQVDPPTQTRYGSPSIIPN